MRAGKDPWNFIDKVKDILELIQVTGIDTVEISSYKLKDVAHIYFTQYKDNKSADATLVTSDYFTAIFLYRFFIRKLREAIVGF